MKGLDFSSMVDLGALLLKIKMGCSLSAADRELASNLFDFVYAVLDAVPDSIKKEEV